MVVLCVGIAALLLPLAKPTVGQSDAPSAAVSKVSFLMLALALWTGLSMFWALNKAEAWFSFLQLSLGFAFFHLSRKAIQYLPNLLETVVKTLLVSMGLLAMIGLLQRIGIDPLGLSDKLFTPNATMTNPNFYADALLLGLPFCIYGIFKLDSRVWRMLAGLTIGLILAGIAISKARSSLIPLLLAAIFFPPVIIWQKWKEKTRWMALLSWALLLAIALWTTNFIFRKKEGTYNFRYIWENGHAITPTTSSVDFRFITWNHTLNLAVEKPIQGCGAGNWKMEIQRLGVKGYDENDGYGLRVPLQPHNEFLGVLSELGFPGLLLVLAIGGMGIFGAGRMAFDRTGKQDKVLGTILLLGLFFFFFDANFSFPMERPFQAMMLMWLLALALPMENAKTKSASHWVGRIGWALSLIVLVGGVATLISRIQADRAMLQLRQQKDAHQPQKMLKTAEAAENWSTQLDAASAMPVDWYRAMAFAELGQLPQAIQAIESALKIAPHQLGVRSTYASLLDMNGRFQEGINVLDELLKTFPDYDEGWLNLSIMFIHANQMSTARKALSRVSMAFDPGKVAQVDQALKAAGY